MAHAEDSEEDAEGEDKYIKRNRTLCDSVFREGEDVWKKDVLF